MAEQSDQTVNHPPPPLGLTPQYVAEPGEYIDIIYNNLYSPPSTTSSDQPKLFRGWRFQRSRSSASINDILIQIGQHVAEGLYDVVSLSASKYSCVVLIISNKSTEELLPKLRFPTVENKARVGLDEILDREEGVVSLGCNSGRPTY